MEGAMEGATEGVTATVMGTVTVTGKEATAEVMVRPSKEIFIFNSCPFLGGGGTACIVKGSYCQERIQRRLNRKLFLRLRRGPYQIP